MSFDLIRVCVIGPVDAAELAGVRLAGAQPTEADGFDLRLLADDADLPRLLVAFRPQVIVTFGPPADFPHLMAAPLEIRKRWLALPAASFDPAAVADRILNAFLANVLEDRFPAEPLVSVFTPTYLTGDRLARPHRSLLAQGYRNWEWVILDDSPDDGATFALAQTLADADHRIHAFRADRPCGAIGEVKRRLCGLARGAVLVELDHDDELTPDALGLVVDAHRRFPEAGFFYTDCAEVFENGENASYAPGWGFGFGGYREETLGGRDFLVANYPAVNAKTIRHIVGVPNHLRAWTRAGYQASGGHHPDLHVGDDYELIVRTFLATRMVHIRRFGYVQYHTPNSGGNTQRRRNGEIQRLVRHLAWRYNERIHARLVELGVDDFVWRDGGALDWDAPNPPETPFANLVYP